tara:strand:- start:1354 stop:1548 length:195 start_codon:yes stop_codon:yes gene_type:complete
MEGYFSFSLNKHIMDEPFHLELECGTFIFDDVYHYALSMELGALGFDVCIKLCEENNHVLELSI